MKPSLGAVSFLNSRPLTISLEPPNDFFDLSYDLPSVCAARLQAGEVDLGLIPAIEYARSPMPYAIVPQVAVGCCGAVLSVRLFYQGSFKNIRRVALDTSSRTSVALLQILLRGHFGMDPQMVAAAPDLDAMLASADAALLIGDPVFSAMDQGVPSVDLGQAWMEFTGLPFVFAFWAGRQDVLTPDQVRRLAQARVQGAQRIGEIARDFSAESGGDAAFYERYLRDYICFDLGDAEIAGLKRFYALAAQQGLIQAEPALRFYSLVE
jgi:chorismate dehydratase